MTEISHKVVRLSHREVWAGGLKTRNELRGTKPVGTPETKALLAERVAELDRERAIVAEVGIAARGTDVVRAYDALRIAHGAGLLRAALSSHRFREPINPDMQAMFLQCVIEYGDSIRQEVGSDLQLLDLFRRILPPYDGGPLVLYRGEGSANRRRRTYGLSWSSDIDVARGFALGLWRESPGGSVLLRTEASPEAIVSAIHDTGGDRFCESEYLVDRRHLKSVIVLNRFEQRFRERSRNASPGNEPAADVTRESGAGADVRMKKATNQ